MVNSFQVFWFFTWAFSSSGWSFLSPHWAKRRWFQLHGLKCVRDSFKCSLTHSNHHILSRYMLKLMSIIPWIFRLVVKLLFELFDCQFEAQKGFDIATGVLSTYSTPFGEKEILARFLKELDLVKFVVTSNTIRNICLVEHSAIIQVNSVSHFLFLLLFHYNFFH